MPEALHRELVTTARKKFPGNTSRQRAYTYGTMRKTGRPSREKKKRAPARHRYFSRQSS